MDSLRNLYHSVWRRLVFLGGNIHLTGGFPPVSLSEPEPQLDYGEALEALELVQPGDVGVHRCWGYLTNAFIPGFMKHAWIHTTDCSRPAASHIVEATSDGVLKRNAVHPFIAKYCILLRPKGVTQEEIQRAIRKANLIVGCEYDVDFKFNIEQELNHFGERDFDSHNFLRNLQQRWDIGFSCTEVVGFSWWHKREQLGIQRVPARGKQVILADNLINPGFDIIWMSRSVTKQVAKRCGLKGPALALVEQYLDSKSPIFKT